MIQIDARNITWDLGRDITYEVLIENLGGYESAKYKLRDNGSLHAERLKKALLEYRRQHNIFEKEDFVVHIFYKGSKVQRVKGVAGDYIHVFSHDESYQYKAYGPDFRHATDAEIKAGKRLEVS